MMEKINNLENVTGGIDGSERIGFTYGTVHDVVPMMQAPASLSATP